MYNNNIKKRFYLMLIFIYIYVIKKCGYLVTI